MNRLIFGIVATILFAHQFGITYAAPPVIPPVLDLKITGDENIPARQLKVFTGEFMRIDYFPAPDLPVKQIWWDAKEYKEFQKFLTDRKLPAQGKATVAADSAEGKALLAEIHKRVITAAEAKAKQQEIERQRQEALKKADKAAK